MPALNIPATTNIFRVLSQPGLCLPHATIPTFNELPIPLEGAFLRGNGDVRDRVLGWEGNGSRKGEDGEETVRIRAVVLDKDDCFARPGENEVWKPYGEHFSLLRRHYPGSRLLIVSNTAGSVSSPAPTDPALSLAQTLSRNTGVPVLSHSIKKPGCGKEIMNYFRSTDEDEGLRDIRSDQIAIVGDRLLTDMCLANDMGSWGVWVRDGVVPFNEKTVFARMEQRIGRFLIRRGFQPPIPTSPFE